MFEELARQYLYHLEFQRNDAVTDEADCRKKYIARCLFRNLSRDISKEHCNGPFRLRIQRIMWSGAVYMYVVDPGTSHTYHLFPAWKGRYNRPIILWFARIHHFVA